MICIHHNKDLDGYASGAVVRKAFPSIKLFGWDYKDPIPWRLLPAGEKIILIDITFSLKDLVALSKDTTLTVIDHHTSFKKEYDELVEHQGGTTPEFTYIYKDGQAACEIAWNYYFPEEPMPIAIRLLGVYDTWRQQEFDWKNLTMPFQYYARVECTSPETFPESWFTMTDTEVPVSIGRSVIRYQEQMDRLACERSSFERPFAGLNALCLNCRNFNSNMMKSVYDPGKHDIMIGLEYTGKEWIISLRSEKPGIDVSVIAKFYGGGGHKQAAGFQCDSLEELWKVPAPAHLTELIEAVSKRVK